MSLILGTFSETDRSLITILNRNTTSISHMSFNNLMSLRKVRKTLMTTRPLISFTFWPIKPNTRPSPKNEFPFDPSSVTLTFKALITLPKKSFPRLAKSSRPTKNTWPKFSLFQYQIQTFPLADRPTPLMFIFTPLRPPLLITLILRIFSTFVG